MVNSLVRLEGKEIWHGTIRQIREILREEEKTFKNSTIWFRGHRYRSAYLHGLEIDNPYRHFHTCAKGCVLEVRGAAGSVLSQELSRELYYIL